MGTARRKAEVEEARSLRVELIKFAGIKKDTNEIERLAVAGFTRFALPRPPHSGTPH